MSRETTIAIFDLDYTLTKRGTWGRLVWRSVRGKPWLLLPLLGSTAMFQWRYKRGLIPRGDVKKTMMRWGMLGKPRAKLEAMAENFADEEVKSGLRPGGIRALAAHKAAGDHILIASAAVDLIVAPISRKLDVDGFVCTKMSWSKDDRLLPDFDGPNCYGAAKADAVKAYLKAHKLENHRIVFYTDSYADTEVLSLADEGVAVDPDDKLKEIAAREGYKIEHWMT